MEKFFKKKSEKRQKEWRLPEKHYSIEEESRPNLNLSRGEYCKSQTVRSLLPVNDIRNYERIETQSIIQKATFPLLRTRINSNWLQEESGWFTDQYLQSVMKTPSTINTSFPLTLTNSNNTQETRIVNTRTVDMEFSVSCNLAVACNCIKGGYISIIKPSSLLSNEPTVSSIYNDALMRSTQVFFNQPITSIQWKDQDQSILCTRRACRELSVFDIHSLTTHTLATLPYFVDAVIPATISNCYFVSMVDGKLKLIDCRQPNRFASVWTLDSLGRKTISCMSLNPERPFELAVAYKNPSSIDRLDIRNTKISPISGNKSPLSLSSQSLALPGEAWILSMTPYLTEEEVVVTLSTGDVAVIHTSNGSHRLYSVVNHTAEMAKWDGIVAKPFRAQLMQESLYIPCIVKRSNNLPIFDFDSIANVNDSISPKQHRIAFPDEVYGCCYSDELKRMVVSCGCNTLEHALYIYSFSLSVCSF